MTKFTRTTKPEYRGYVETYGFEETPDSLDFTINDKQVSKEVFDSFFDITEIKETCANCKFFWKPPEDDTGRCRKSGPINALATLNAPWLNWPRTEADLWCGSWEEKG